MNNKIYQTDQKLFKLNESYKTILTDYKYFKNLNPISTNQNVNSDYKKYILILIENLQKLLLLLNGNSTKSYGANYTNGSNSFIQSDELEFINAANDQIVDIIAYIGESIDNLSQQVFNLRESLYHDLFDFYFKYCELILNFAEKSPLKFNHLANTFNKLVNYLVNASFQLINLTSGSFGQNLDAFNLSKLSLEIYRALGSLVYENGPKLNELNLNRLLVSNTSNQNSNLLFKIRFQIENELNLISKTNTSAINEETFDLVNKINLISVQLLFNLTLPIKTQNLANLTQDPNIFEYEFIDDKYKARCASMLVKTLRFNNTILNLSLSKIKNETSYTENISKHFSTSNKNYNFDDESILNTSKALTKALQGVENLFSSIKNDQVNQQINWFQSSLNEFQLGDILAIVKDLSFCGVQNTPSKNAPLTKNSNKENKLEPSNVHEILLPLEKSKKSNDLTENDENNIGGYKYDDQGANNESDDENKCVEIKSNKKQNNPNKKYNNNSKYSKTSVSNNKGGKFNRNNSGKQFQPQQQQQQQQKNQLNDSTLSDLNSSVQCLREAQVPLIQYRNNSNNYGTDSDVSTDSSLSTSSGFYLEKSIAKVRVGAVGVLLTIFQKLDKRTVLSYWDSFLGSGNNNLIWSVKNDPSPKVRLIAATALSVYLECVRAFFTIAAAEDTTNAQNLCINSQSSQSFLPISFTIASIIRQLHKDILVSLHQRESFQLNQIQLLKCLQGLIKATPYQKLKPGLIYKLIISLNILLNQKSTNLNLNQRSNNQKEKYNVLTEILLCLEIILTSHHQMVEVHLALLSPINKASSNFINQQNFSSKNSTSTSSINELSSDDLDLSSKLEKLTTNIKVPNLTQSRVKYFYEANNSFSLTGSNTVSGQITPSYPVSDLIQDENSQEANNKSWLVSFCIKNSSLVQTPNTSLSCLEILTIICRKYFDLLQRDLFFEDICKLILENLDSLSNSTDYQLINQIKLKNLKFLEEFARCLATNDLRQINSIDLNDCCKFWSNLLNSKLLSEYLVDEQRYLLSSAACDCLASIGASIFELLPFQKRIFCLTNLLHLTKSQSSLIRAASIRALGVYITFTSLKEDQNFLNDLSICLLNLLLNDSNNLVRQKTAWSMSNLSEVMIENGDRLGNIFTDEFNLTVFLRLLDAASSSCQRESDKLKSYLVRTLGNLINYISLVDLESITTQLNLNTLERSITKAVEVLCSCRNVKMLKVKWNLSHAIGVAMRRFNTWKLHLNNPKWLKMFYDALLELFTQSNNFKVRINACIALMTINLNDITLIRTEYLTFNNKREDIPNNQSETIYIKLWICLIEAFSKLKNENIDATNELQHKNTLTHQLCKLFTYLCKYLRIIDLEKVMLKSLNDLKVNSMPKNMNYHQYTLTLNELRSYLVNYIIEIYDQIDSHKQEVQFYNEALTQLNLLNSNKKTSIDEDCINLLNTLLQKPINNKKAEESESSEAETLNTDNENDVDNYEDKQFKNKKDNEYRKKFPFKSVYD